MLYTSKVTNKITTFLETSEVQGHHYHRNILCSFSSILREFLMDFTEFALWNPFVSPSASLFYFTEEYFSLSCCSIVIHSIYFFRIILCNFMFLLNSAVHFSPSSQICIICHVDKEGFHFLYVFSLRNHHGLSKIRND